MSIQPEPAGAWILLIGPGERLARLPVLLRSFPARGEMGPADPIRALEELADLLCEFPESGRLVLDSELLRSEDVGLVLAFLARRPGFVLELVGLDPGSGAARRLARHERARFWAAPIDLDALEAWARAPLGRSGASAPVERSAERRADPGERRADLAERDAELALGGPDVPREVRAEVERILGSPRRGARRPRPTPAAAEEARSPASDALLAESAPPEPRAAVGPRAPAPYFRDQMSDLRDFAQRMELGLARLRERASEAAGELAPDEAGELERGLDELEVETLRLSHFARTLGYVASPPARGDQRIELAGMLRELLSAPLAGGGPGVEMELDSELWVRADKTLLALALDALVVLATRSARAGDGPGGAVRARGKRDAETDSVRVELAFPAGPLAGVPIERLFEPYALRRILPELGPNALAAAAGIVHGQGGSLQVAPGRGGRLRVALVLPADLG